MDDISDLDITINGSPRDETTEFTFQNIPGTYYGNEKDIESTEDNTIFLEFNKVVDFNALELVGTDLPEEITVLVTGIDQNRDTHMATIQLTADIFVLDEFPAVIEVNITVISSSQPKFTVGTEFSGCIHPGM